MQKKKNKVIEEEEDEVDQNQDNETEYHPIEILQDNGINNNDIKKLVEAGFNSLESLAYTPKKNLVTIKGLSDIKVEKIMKVVYDILKLGIQPCAVALAERKKLIRITSGSKELDSLLGGGFESNSAYITDRRQYGRNDSQNRRPSQCRRKKLIGAKLSRLQ